jgi:hypothetical protein
MKDDKEGKTSSPCLEAREGIAGSNSEKQNYDRKFWGSAPTGKPLVRICCNLDC